MGKNKHVVLLDCIVHSLLLKGYFLLNIKLDCQASDFVAMLSSPTNAGYPPQRMLVLTNSEEADFLLFAQLLILSALLKSGRLWHTAPRSSQVKNPNLWTPHTQVL
jgi:hypothetical protein